MSHYESAVVWGDASQERHRIYPISCKATAPDHEGAGCEGPPSPLATLAAASRGWVERSPEELVDLVVEHVLEACDVHVWPADEHIEVMLEDPVSGELRRTLMPAELVEQLWAEHQRREREAS